MSFADLKKNRADAISKLTAAVEKIGDGSKKSYVDDRFWQPTVDKAGNGYAVIRFLPARSEQELPWIRYWDHGFKGPTGRWYIENSLTSIGGQDPVAEMNSKLWNSGREEDKEIARQRKRRLHYVSNILVVSDPANPSNEGKVFLYKFGKKIFDKILDKMQPQFADEQPVNPFDFWQGCDFKLKIRQVEGYRNYDKSEFAAQTALFNGEEGQLEKVYNGLHNLSEFLDPKSYKSYAELKKKLLDILGEDGGVLSTAESVTLDEQAPAPSRKASPAPSPISGDESGPAEKDDGEDTLSYFSRLAREEG
jgi:hypothetical protein